LGLPVTRLCFTSPCRVLSIFFLLRFKDSKVSSYCSLPTTTIVLFVPHFVVIVISPIASPRPPCTFTFQFTRSQAVRLTVSITAPHVALYFYAFSTIRLSTSRCASFTSTSLRKIVHAKKTFSPMQYHFSIFDFFFVFVRLSSPLFYLLEFVFLLPFFSSSMCRSLLTALLPSYHGMPSMLSVSISICPSPCCLGIIDHQSSISSFSNVVAAVIVFRSVILSFILGYAVDFYPQASPCFRRQTAVSSDGVRPR